MWRAEGREEEGEQAATLVADIPPLRGLHDAWAAGGALGGDRGGLPQLTHLCIGIRYNFSTKTLFVIIIILYNIIRYNYNFV